MKSTQVTSLTPEQVRAIRMRWRGDSSFIGYPDAERDTVQNRWFDNLLVQPDWFSNAISATTTVAVARKGAGKSAVRLTSIERRKPDTKTLVVEASAENSPRYMRIAWRKRQSVGTERFLIGSRFTQILFVEGLPTR